MAKKKSESDLNSEAVRNFYKMFHTPRRKTGRAGGNRPWSKPIKSDALAVDPSQIPEAMESDRKLGVSVEYEPKYGRPLFRSRGQRKRYMEAYGFYDRSGGYGDAQKGKTRLSGYVEPDVDFSHLDEASGPPGVEERTASHNTAYFGVAR